MLRRIFPFIAWFQGYGVGPMRTDLIAGITVALVLIPQSMAYAQLAGLPGYCGLYAAFLPPMVAALFGSSRQLATGPVAIVSLMTAAALEPIATAGSDAYFAYAILLALIVGLFQLTLGLLRLGMIVNFLSHPVVNGFTNAAAIIIATSQLSKLFGVYVDGADHHYETVYRVIVAAIHYTHLPSLGLALLAFAIMYGLRRLNPRIPFVLAAVAVTSLIAWSTGFEHNTKAPLDRIRSAQATELVAQFNATVGSIATAADQKRELGGQIDEAKAEQGARSPEVLELRHRRELAALQLSQAKERSGELRGQLRALWFRGVEESGGLVFYPADQVPAGADHDGRHWRIKVGNNPLAADGVTMMGGGAVVGTVPRGLPTIGVPSFDLKTVLHFLPVAIIISLLGFMEAISIAKAMGAKTRQRIDPNQELIGQGLANILGSFGKSYPTSGSFSRSAVNIGAGATTGMSSVFTSLIVVITLLFLTPLLYFIPQSVLGAVIMMAVIGLINVKGFLHSYRAQRYDGIIAIVSFLCTLAFAPHLDKGIMVGVVLSLAHYLYRNSRPTIASLSRHPDESFRDAEKHGLRKCQYLALIRFEGPLFFANTSYLEDRITERLQATPTLRHVHLVGNGINEIDASGEETLSLLIDRLRSQGKEISFSGLNEQVLELFRRTHLYEKIGEHRIFPTQAAALAALHPRAHHGVDEESCPLLEVAYAEADLAREVLLPDSRVVVLASDPKVSATLARKLNRKGATAAVVQTGGKVLDELDERSYDAVIIDPGKDAKADPDLVSEIERRRPGTPIILLGTPASDPQPPSELLDHQPVTCSLTDLFRVLAPLVVEKRSRDAGTTLPTSIDTPSSQVGAEHADRRDI